MMTFASKIEKKINVCTTLGITIFDLSVGTCRAVFCISSKHLHVISSSPQFIPGSSLEALKHCPMPALASKKTQPFSTGMIDCNHYIKKDKCDSRQLLHPSNTRQKITMLLAQHCI